MAHGPIRSWGKEQLWRDVLTRWRDSGLTIRDFCRRQRISEPSFYAWRRALAKREQSAAVNDQAVTFVPLSVRPESPVHDASVEVVLANGRRLRVPVGIAAGVVRDLLAVLEESPCSV